MTLAGYDGHLAEIVALIDRYAEDQKSLENARNIDGSGWYGDDWKAICETTALSAVCVPEELGGLGLGVDVLIAAAEPIGKHLFAVPYLSSATIATLTLSACGETGHSLLVLMAEGSATTTVAWAEDASSWLVPTTPRVRAVATDDNSGYLLSGVKPLVLDADVADHVLVFAAESDGVPGLFLCRSDAPGLTINGEKSLDPVTRSGRCDFQKVEAIRIAEGELAVRALEDAIDIGRLVLSAMQIGAARATFDTTMEYLGQRRQFDRTISSFQAVKHQLADMTVDVETGWALIANATRTAAEVPEQRRIFAPLVAAYVSDVYFKVAESALHLHGGIGFTWEADPHLYLKNAIATEAILGSPVELRELVAERTSLAADFAPLAVGREA
ncbi:acyl-CoA dehydrogenase family protein [Rhodococcus globerulus]|uniref:acyl-CoA dehydrogenase family protein n=1 Tax=Rhodococcus globerulus TaxID=33008 RepID=UPI00068C04D0|nr:acyl-CoA dehydrogenase [Rhodococcus globerulus]PVX59573.1 alkylation response protein AidB-like acyl-CoA dehydrogenase [Rhodococcus globerulus]